MIARQRNNLGLTFAAASQNNQTDAMQRRLTTNQNEILDATAELADGLAARGLDSFTLQTAVGAMGNAVSQLQGRRLNDATSSEQKALAALIRTRQDVRKMLSQSSSSSSECRTFDRQQRQKLRTPESKEKKKQEQLAEARKQLDQLAQQQRKWSEDVKSGSPATPPQTSSKSPSEKPQNASQNSSSSSTSSSSEKPESDSRPPNQPGDADTNADQRPELEQRQQEMLDRARSLLDQLAQLEQASDAAKAHAEQAAKNVQQGLAELQQQQSEQAAESGKRAADQFEQLSDHLATAQSTDTLDRLHQARGFAQHLAQQQTQLRDQLPGIGVAGTDSSTRSGSPNRAPAKFGARERELATQAELLAELLDRLRADAASSPDSAQPAIEAVNADLQPSGIASQMSRAATTMDQGQWPVAAKEADGVVRSLNELADRLGQLARDLGHPKLQDLIATEEQLAGLLEQLADENRAGAVDARLAELEGRLDEWANSDPRLSGAMDKMRSQRSATTGSSSGTSGPTATGGVAETESTPRSPLHASGFGTRRELVRASWREVNRALQAKIQEIIVAGALLDANEPVPSEFQELVNEYYRRLSDDLR